MCTTAKINQLEAKNFILAGKAIFTAKSLKTNTHYTYRVIVPADKSKESSNIYFVGVLTGTDNTSDYTYAGTIKVKNGQPLFELGKKSRMTADAPSVKAIDYIVNKLVATGHKNEALELWHEGKCCRCGRKLTTPESIERGIGPECASIKDKF